MVRGEGWSPGLGPKKPRSGFEVTCSSTVGHNVPSGEELIQDNHITADINPGGRDMTVELVIDGENLWLMGSDLHGVYQPGQLAMSIADFQVGHFYQARHPTGTHTGTG